MAVINTVLGSTLQRTVLTKPPDVVRQHSPWPRAMVNAFIQGGTLDAKPVNDQQELQIGVVLDPKFAYRLQDFSVSLIQDVANDWVARAYIEVQDAIRNLPSGQKTRHAVALDDTRQNVSALEMWVTVAGPDRQPNYIFQALPNDLVIFNFFATNEAAAAGLAGTVDSWFRFLEYEIEQAEWFALHYPVLTRS